MSSLFRAEVIDGRAARLEGRVILAQPSSTKWMTALLGLIVFAAGVWLTTGTYARIETVPGIIATAQASTKVIAVMPGVVTHLAVQEGQLVRKGEPLATINLDRQTPAGGAVMQRSLNTLVLRRRIAEEQLSLGARRADSERKRLNSIISSAATKLASLRRQIDLQRDIVASNQQMLDRLGDVVKRGFVSGMEFERRRQEMISSRQALSSLEQQFVAIEGEAEQAKAQIGSMTVEAAQGAAEIETSLQGMEQQQVQLEGEQAYVISAPIDGRVGALQTAEGRSATPDAPLMIILPPGGQLRAELYAPTRAMGFVRPGQEVRILYDAFPYQRFGSFGARVADVSRVVIDPRGTDIPVRLEEPFYRIIVDLDRQSIDAFGQVVPLQPNMSLRANIVLERQSFLAWLLQPLNAVLKRTS